MAKKKNTRGKSTTSDRANMEAGMIFEELAKLTGMKSTLEFKVIKVDIDGQEVCLLTRHGGTVTVDLRDQYLTEAQKWQAGCIIKATIAPTPSRFAPSLVWVFEGDIQLGSLPE